MMSGPVPVAAPAPVPVPMPLLRVRDLSAWYGKSQVLRALSLQIAAGETVALLGRNGSGRSTVARALMGLVSASGSVRLRETELLGRPTHAIAGLGLGYVPESRDVFPTLTVEQNLRLGEKPAPHGAAHWTMDEMYRLFPILRARRNVAAGVLSGGEQQVLSLARGLLGNPELLIVDEPTEGLAPQWVETVATFLAELRSRGVAILLIEQKLAITLRLADRVLVLGHGQVVYEGTPTELVAATAIQRDWLGV